MRRRHHSIYQRNRVVYIAIVSMDTPPCDHDTAVAMSLGATETYTALKDKGLLMKFFLSRDTGGSGGVYVWNSRADADAWFTPEWFKRLQERYGAKPTVTFYDSFVHVDNTRNEVVVDGKAATV